jgi:hypothetical protein
MNRELGAKLSVALLLLALAASGWAGGALAAAEPHRGENLPVTNRNLTRNGGFDLGAGTNIPAWWSRGGAPANAQIEAGVDAQGGPAVKIFTNGADYATASAIYQELHLPTAVTAATLSFAVRVAPAYTGEAPQPGELINGWIAVAPVSGEAAPDTNNAIVAGAVYGENVGSVTAWQQFSVTFDQSSLDALNAARAANQRLVLMIGTVANSWRLSLLVDDVAFQVNGSQSVPAFSGEIAFVDGKQIKRIQPSSGAAQTIWTHPGAAPSLLSVRWNPTATELGFTSDHETNFSPIEDDLYGIRPDGSGLRRITNAPSQAAILGGGFATGSVRLNIFNNGSALETFAPFVVSLRGASELKSFALPAYQQTGQILIENVADLGGDQAVIFIYSSPACGANRRDVAGFVNVLPGQTVEANLTFNATNCNGFVGAARELTWKRDGAEIGYVLGNGPFKIEAAGRATPGDPWFGGNDLIDSTVAWSPVNDLVLYDVIGAGGGIYRRDVAGQQPGQLIVNRTLLGDPVKPAWLPDGSGFLYIFAGNVFSADAAGQNRQQLTFFAPGEQAERVSPAPDGAFVVIERKLGSASTLWLMERGNAANLWPLATGSKPDWSRVNPSTPAQPTATPTRTPTAQPGATATPTPTLTPPPGATATPTPQAGNSNERVFLPAVQR